MTSKETDKISFVYLKLEDKIMATPNHFPYGELLLSTHSMTGGGVPVCFISHYPPSPLFYPVPCPLFPGLLVQYQHHVPISIWVSDDIFLPHGVFHFSARKYWMIKRNTGFHCRPASFSHKLRLLSTTPILGCLKILPAVINKSHCLPHGDILPFKICWPGSQWGEYSS